MSEIKLIALDMDGTLLNEENVVTENTKRIIKQAEQQGIYVVISTGRPLATSISYAKELELSSYIITTNGAEIYTVEEELIEQHTINATKMEQLWHIGNDKKLNMWLLASDAVFVQARRPNDFAAHDWLKIGYDHLDEVDKLHVMEQLKQVQDLEITNSTPENIEVNEKGINKASGLRTLCSRLEIEMNEVMAVGDSLNDFKMIKEAGIGIAMGNAQDDILNIADYVTSTNREDGVAKAIETYALKK